MCNDKNWDSRSWIRSDLIKDKSGSIGSGCHLLCGLWAVGCGHVSIISVSCAMCDVRPLMTSSPINLLYPNKAV